MKFITLTCNYDRKGKYFLFLFLFTLKCDIMILDKARKVRLRFEYCSFSQGDSLVGVYKERE